MYYNKNDFRSYLEGDSLTHYGVLGMKWGVRRYQNEDGSYTSEGQRRNAKDVTKASKLRSGINTHRVDKIRKNKTIDAIYRDLGSLLIDRRETMLEVNKRWLDADQKVQKKISTSTKKLNYSKELQKILSKDKVYQELNELQRSQSQAVNDTISRYLGEYADQPIKQINRTGVRFTTVRNETNRMLSELTYDDDMKRMKRVRQQSNNR